jgi:myosin heavy subunit
MIRISEAETQAKVYAAERDEYRRLLQVERDRIREMGGLAKTIEGKEGDTQNLTENIRRLEIEKADLIRKLEFERSSQKAGMETADSSSESLVQLSDQLDFMKAELRKLDQERNDLASQLDQSSQAAKMAQQELAELKTSIENGGQALDTEAELQTQTLLADIATLEAENAKLRQDVNQQALKTSALPVTDTPKPDMQMLRRLNIIEAENQRLMKELSEKPKPMPKVSTIAQASPPIVKSTPKEPQSISEPVQSQQPIILSGDSIRRVIKQSNIPLKSPIQRVERTAQTNFAAFTWDTGVVYGNAEQAKMKSGQQFDQAVQGYLQKTAKRCKGTFDQGKTNVQLSIPAQSYDIACIDNSGRSGHTASIVFFEKEGMFHAIAHEGGIQQFQIAMDMRDRVVNAIQTIY